MVRCMALDLALGLASRLDIRVTMPPCYQERTCKRIDPGIMYLIIPLSIARRRQSCGTWPAQSGAGPA